MYLKKQQQKLHIAEPEKHLKSSERDNHHSDLCCLSWSGLSNQNEALVPCNDVAEALLVLPHWEL